MVLQAKQIPDHKGMKPKGTRMSIDKTKIAEQFIGAIPHSRALGMKLTEVGPGTAEIMMEYDERFVGDPETGVIHGGAVSALMDTCCVRPP